MDARRRSAVSPAVGPPASSTLPFCVKGRHERRSAACPQSLALEASLLRPALDGLTSQTQHVPHREPAAAAVDPPRRFERAASERCAVARRVRQRDRLPAASNPTVCVPGMYPARVDDDIDRFAAARFNHALQGQRRPGRRVFLRRVMRFVNPGRKATARTSSSRGALADRQQKRSRRWRSSAPRSRPLETRRPHARTCASDACQPVVPITSDMPRAASRGALATTASAVEKSIATSAGGTDASRRACLA